MKIIAKIAWLHVMLALAGVVLCAIGREGAGALVLCTSAMSLMVVKAGELIAPDVRDELADLSDELIRQREVANVMYRRAMTLHSYLEGQGESLGDFAPHLAEILCRINSVEPTVDAAIFKLRDLRTAPVV
ncbi:hypothetical protein [Burkholderia sp. BCC1977]|uniref:hypothetical protein n=1 Tax=Burkholderia sp. BCC1977 TaxID=2817440 RepID=UPI002ABE5AAE|nr:hypothetical protein [Burkholderia sp. BCC1977]